jgi:hypothetical protein
MIDQLREKFSSQLASHLKNDDYFLYTWLKARDFDFDAASYMLAKHLRYRRALRMDEAEYQDWKPHVVFNTYYPQGDVGFSKLGHPIAHNPWGYADNETLMKSMRSSDCFKGVLYIQEYRRRWRCAEGAQRVGAHVGQVLYIHDLEGLSLSSMSSALHIITQMSTIVEQNTPEITYKIFLVNAPSIFWAIYKLIKPLMPAETKKKLHICKGNGKEELLVEVEPDQLPVHYGGTMRGPDGDPKCAEKIRYGGKVPPEHWQDEAVHEGARKIVISSGRKHTIPITTSSPNITLRWHWTNAHGDIGFGVFADDGSEDTSSMEMVEPYFVLMGWPIPDCGTAKLVRPGRYLIVFDNSFSRVTSKTIQFWAQLENEEGKLTDI